MEFTKDLRVQTDDQGNFKNIYELDVPLVPIRNLDIKARLRSPSGTTTNGTIDIDATDGSPSNDPKQFALLGGGEWVYIGKFQIAFGGERFRVEVSGTTAPPQPNAELVFEIQAW